ncbi:glycosyltransferase [Candidatus Uhrbacteria bacterium]|nr:glycosyltransferase [Candidatus Uhrbacteria bacterium]
MKIAIGMNLQAGSFGGGNQFATLLTDHLRKLGHEVFFDLTQPDLDLILMTDPRTRLKSVAFGPIEIMQYVRTINPSVLLVHRINECDERKGTRTLNRILSTGNKFMDHTVFISSWLEGLHRQQNQFTKNSSVIFNGADPTVFTYQKKQLPTNRKIRLVTHHWSANWNKGWDVYTHLDQLLAQTPLGERLEFTYIGNAPNLPLKKIKVLPPRSGKELAQALKEHDLYITASLNEPAGMHHIEAASCGLPLLYRLSGALPEYCTSYGVAFNGPEDTEASLEEILKKYDHFAEQLETYPYTSTLMCRSYSDLFQDLISNRESILLSRHTKLFSHTNQIKTSLSLTWLSLMNR